MFGENLRHSALSASSWANNIAAADPAERRNSLRAHCGSRGQTPQHTALPRPPVLPVSALQGKPSPPGSGGPRDALGALLAPQGRQGLWEAAAPAAGLAGASGFSKGAHDPTGWKGLWVPVSVSCRECFGKLRKVVESCKCKSDFLTFTKKQRVIFLCIVFSVPLFLFFYFSSYWKDIHTRLKKQRKQIIILCNSITLRCAKPKIKLQSDLCIFFPVLSYLIFFQISTLKKPTRPHYFFRENVQSLGTLTMKFHANYPQIFAASGCKTMTTAPATRAQGGMEDVTPYGVIYWSSLLKHTNKTPHNAYIFTSKYF